jgi:hypothetical protein
MQGLAARRTRPRRQKAGLKRAHADRRSRWGLGRSSARRVGAFSAAVSETNLELKMPPTLHKASLADID